MMATAKQPKSILKKTAISYPATTSSKADRDREVALYHANLIQQRKDIELEILLSTETLIDYPISLAPFSASNPSLSDANEVKRLLRPFQPSDYDALIEERNINEHCGYTLCANNRVKDTTTGKYRLIGTSGKAKDFRILEKGELEKWCSDACGRRALYVRIQLSETPAWERGAVEYGAQLDLLDEPKSEDSMVVEAMETLNLGEEDIAGQRRDAADLAMERGDTSRGIMNRLVDVTIEEKEITKPAQAPSLEADELSGRLDTMHLTLEGHTSTFGSRRDRRHHEEDDDVDTDWKM